MVGEELHVGAEDPQVRVRHDVVPEVGRVVPDVEPVADLRPADDVVAERLVALVGQRLAEGTLDAAQLDDDIVPRLGDLRGLARVLIGQRADRDVRELLLDVGGDRVDEPQHQSGGAAFFLLDRGAVLALAVADPVVLRDRGDGRRRIVPQPLLEVLDQFLTHLLVRQAQLRVLGRSLAVDLAEPLGVLREVLLRRDQRIERVHESFIDVLAAVLGLQPMSLAVALVARRPVAVEGIEPEGRAILQRRHVPDVQSIDS